MASPGQKRGLCGHFMAGFDFHAYCARCRDKGKGDDPCIKNEKDCQFCNSLSTDQKARLATPSYQEKKKKHDQKAIKEESSSTLVDPSSVTVIGVAKDVQQACSTPDLNSRKRQNSEESNRSTKERKAGSSVSKGSEKNHQLNLPSSQQTINLNNSTRNGLKGLVDWRQCFLQRLSLNQSQCLHLWLYLQLNLKISCSQIN